VPVPVPLPELPAILSWSKPSMGIPFSVFGHGQGHGHGKYKMGQYQNIGLTLGISGKVAFFKHLWDGSETEWFFLHE
jgi:hypothetical protein